MADLYCDGSGMIIGFLGHEVKPCDLKSCDDCRKFDEDEKYVDFQYEGMIKMRKFKVTNEEHLYGECVGILIAETTQTVILSISNEDVVFDKSDVTEIN